MVQITPYDSQAIYLGLTPDGKYAAENDANLTMHLVDTKTGTPLPGALDAMVDKVADPAFSPDGKLFAFSSNVIGAYPVEFTRADLDVFDFDQATLAFTNRRQIVNGGKASGPVFHRQRELHRRPFFHGQLSFAARHVRWNDPFHSD